MLSIEAKLGRELTDDERALWIDGYTKGHHDACDEIKQAVDEADRLGP